MSLLEGTHYGRSFHQPRPLPPKSKELVTCLFCDTSIYPDDAKHGVGKVGRQKRCKGVLRLDKLLKHIEDNHPRSIQVEGRSLLAMSFSRTILDDGRNRPELLVFDDDDGPVAPDI
jgi:hypothetical protein